ncbi:MAG TPA: ABC transporter substrate-binding protein [Candidatus Acidoferrum sp.]|nr:ABC transporter substrate-binding protein [Candidatus Acidoferrum sp.]
MRSFPRLAPASLYLAAAVLCAASVACAFGLPDASGASHAASTEDFLVTNNPPGHDGGQIVVALRSEPKTLNPVLATDISSRDVIRCLTADLIHINRGTLKTEPALAESWRVSPDGRVYTLKLRRGVRFSDGQPFTADDVVFSFRVYLDPKVNSSQRDQMIVGGKPIVVQKIDEGTVRFTLAEPYAAAERLFDSVAMLPRHLLENDYNSGKFDQVWPLTTAPAQFAGLGPFRLKEYVPGVRIVLERNPYYWKKDRADTQLPYLDRLVFLFVDSEDAQVIRFQSGDTDVLSRFNAEDFSILQQTAAARHYRLYDLGPGLEFNFLFFNLNDLSSKNLPEIAAKQAWFRDVRFRQAVSAAVDREAIVRLVYNGRATPIWGPVTPGDKLWTDHEIPHPARSLDTARQLLKSAGFSWTSAGGLIDPHGKPVEFSILSTSSNVQRSKMATLIQDDLSQLGMNVHVVPLEFRTVVDRLLNTYNYEAAVMGLANGDTDPNPEMNVWLSSGGTHLWHPGQQKPATPWEAEIDRLMEQQLVTMNYAKRKELYDRVQELLYRQMPLICLVSPDLLAGAKNNIADFHPAILDPYALWNVEQLYVQ